MKIRYIGPSSAGVDIPLPNGDVVQAPHGEPVDIDVELAERLLEQDTFERVDDKPSKQTKAADAAPSDEET